MLPALDQYTGISGVIKPIEGQLRQTVPQVTLRLVLSTDPPLAGAKSVLVNVPGAPATSALVSIDLPRGVVLNSWQTRVLRVASRLIALLQRLEPSAERPPQILLPVPAVLAAIDVKTPAEPVEAPPSGGWQKIVVRYAEGQMLKGYTQDFSAGRAQFSLWPSLTSSPQERVIVPLARLKGVFFVRDFAGNPGYIERSETGNCGAARSAYRSHARGRRSDRRTDAHLSSGWTRIFRHTCRPSRQQHPRLHCRQRGQAGEGFRNSATSFQLPASGS